MKQTDAKASIYIDSINKLANLSDSTHIINRNLSRKFAYRTLELAKKINTPEASAIAFQTMGFAWLNEQNDSSFIYYTKALKSAGSGNLLNIRIRILYRLARLYSIAYNYKPAVILLDSVIYYADRVNDFTSVSDAFNALGAIQIELHDSLKAKEMFTRALNIAKDHGILREQGTALANLATFETNPVRALSLKRQAMNLFQKTIGTEQEKAGIIINMGYSQHIPDSALFYYRSVLKIAEPSNLKTLEFAAYNAMAGSYIEKGDLLSAEKCMVEHSLPLAKTLTNPGNLAISYDSYADVLARKDNYKEAFVNEKNALSAQRQVDTKTATEQVRLISAMLDLKNKEAEISKKENDIRNQKIHLQQMKLILVICLLIIIGSVLTIFWLTQNARINVQREQIRSARKIIEIEEREKGRLAREMHDTIGHLVQGITAYINSIKLQDPGINHEISVKLNDLGQNIRRISHQMSQVATEEFSFHELMTGLCEDVQSLTGLRLDYSIPSFSIQFSEEMNLHMYRIVQELLTNANKYASQANIRLKFAMVEKKLLLFYKDDGPGFDSKKENPHFFGLLNIFERVKLLGGTAHLLTSPGKGTSWDISIPVIQSFHTQQTLA